MHLIELLDAVENAAAQVGVSLDVLEFGRRERTRLAEHVVVDADLADVVQQAGQVDRVEIVRAAANFAGQANREAGNAIAVTAGVRVFGVDGRGECPHDAAEEFGLFVVEGDVAAVNAEDRGHAGHEAGFDRAELGFAVGDVAGAGVVEREQPAEVPIAFADRHADDFADVRVEPGWRARSRRD